MPNSTPAFPDPFLVASGRRFWSVRQYREWVAEAAGLPEPDPREDDENLLSAAQLRERLGGVSDMWLYRHRRRPENPNSEPPAAA